MPNSPSAAMVYPAADYRLTLLLARPSVHWRIVMIYWLTIWLFVYLFVMFKKCLSKCHDKLAAKHIVLFCLASNKNSITMLHNCSSTNRKSCSHKFFLGYKLICNNKKNKKNYAWQAISTLNEDPGLSRLFWGVVVFRYPVIIGIEVLSKWRHPSIVDRILKSISFPYPT
jgi:hypothetical protein